MSFLGAVWASILAFFAGLFGDPAVPPAVHAVVPKSAIVLSGDEIRHLGIEVIPAQEVAYTPRVHGYGVVVDLTALAQSNSDVATAAAAAHQSSADLARARALFAQNAGESKQALDAAEKQAAADAAALALAERKEAAQFGQRAPWRGGKRAVLTPLYGGHAVLVQATFPLGTVVGQRPQSLSVAHLAHAPDAFGWNAARIWNAPADPTIPGNTFYALVPSSDLAQGEHVLVYAPTGPAQAGVRISDKALVVSEEKTWCYVETAPGVFERVAIDIDHPMAGGYFIGQGISGNAPVVVKGMGLLLSRELGVAVQDEY
jgi:hypothetical protein